MKALTFFALVAIISSVAADCPTIPTVVWTASLGTPVQLPPAPTITSSIVDGNLQFQVDAAFVNQDFTWLIDFKQYAATSDLQGCLTANRDFSPVVNWADLWARGTQPAEGSLSVNLDTAAYPQNLGDGDDDDVDAWLVYGTETAPVTCDIVRWLGKYTLGTLTSEGVLGAPTVQGDYLAYRGAVHTTAISPIDTGNEAAGVYLARFERPFSILVDEVVTAFINTGGVGYNVQLTLLEAEFQNVVPDAGGEYLIRFQTEITDSSTSHDFVSAVVTSSPVTAGITGPSQAGAVQEWELLITFPTGQQLAGDYVIDFTDNSGAVLRGTITVADHTVQVDDEDEVTVTLSTSLHLFPASETADFFAGDTSSALVSPYTIGTEELFVLNRLGGIPRDDTDLLISIVDVDLCPVSETVDDTCDGASHILPLIVDYTIDSTLAGVYSTRGEDDTSNFDPEYDPDDFANLPGDAGDGLTSIRDSGMSFLTAPLLQEEGYGAGTAVRVFVRTRVLPNNVRRTTKADGSSTSTSNAFFVLGTTATTPDDNGKDDNGDGSKTVIIIAGAAGVAVAAMAIVAIVMWRKRRQATNTPAVTPHEGGVEFEA